MNNWISEKPQDWKEMWRRLTWNDNLSPEILKEIEEIKTLGLWDSWILTEDLLTPESQARLIDILKNNTPTHPWSVPRKIIW